MVVKYIGQHSLTCYIYGMVVKYIGQHSLTCYIYGMVVKYIGQHSLSCYIYGMVVKYVGLHSNMDYMLMFTFFSAGIEHFHAIFIFPNAITPITILQGSDD